MRPCTLRLEGLSPLLLSLVLTLPLLGVSRADFPGSCDSQPDDCTCLYTDTVTQKKMEYDLSGVSLDNGAFKFPEIRGSDGYLYWYNPCHNSRLEGGCESVIGCQMWEEVMSGLGTVQTNRFTTEGTKVLLVARSTDHIADRTMKVELVCRDIPNTVVTTSGDQVTPYIYEFEMVGPAACPRDTGSGGSIQVIVSVTVGTWMCIFAFVALVIYVVAGVLIQHYKFGKAGKEVVPNYTFWTGLPSLVKDGAMFIVVGIKGLGSGGGGGSSGEYEKL